MGVHTCPSIRVIIGVTILSSALVVTANLVVDLVQALLDPRVRVH